MNLEGIFVKHKAFGEGVVKKQDGIYVVISFSQGEKKFVYPDAFKDFISVVDETIAMAIQKDIERIEAEKFAAIAAQQEKEDVIIADQASTFYWGPNISQKGKGEFRGNEVSPSGRQYFFVFQNKSFDAERRGGYLWAPKFNQSGRRVSHWIMMKEVHKGDVIFHSVNKNIAAISIAKMLFSHSARGIEARGNVGGRW